MIMHQDTSDLDALISKAESGEIEEARNDLRHFVQNHPSTLLAWKWLADIAENVKERSMAIRRAQLLAPGDPWVIEAKKHRRPIAQNALKTKPPATPKHPLTSRTALDESVTESVQEINAISENPINLPDDILLDDSATVEEQHPARPVNTDGYNPQPKWAIWMAAVMGAAGIALLVTAWQLGSF